MKQPTLFFFSILISILSYGQKKISGIVIDSLAPVKDAHIVNLTTNKGTISDGNGQFEIFAKLGDELEISSVQHKTKIITIANITLKNGSVEIRLSIKTYVLDEIELKKTDLIGSLGIDLKDVPTDNRPKINAISLGLPFAGMKKLSPIDRKIRTATSASGGIPLDFMLNVISGRLRKLKEEKRVIEENFDVNYMFNNYRFFIQDYYKIKQEHLYRFLYFCTSDPSYNRIMLKDELKMITFLKLMSQKFKAIIPTDD